MVINPVGVCHVGFCHYSQVAWMAWSGLWEATLQPDLPFWSEIRISIRSQLMQTYTSALHMLHNCQASNTKAEAVAHSILNCGGVLWLQAYPEPSAGNGGTFKTPIRDDSLTTRNDDSLTVFVPMLRQAFPKSSAYDCCIQLSLRNNCHWTSALESDWLAHVALKLIMLVYLSLKFVLTWSSFRNGQCRTEYLHQACATGATATCSS